MLARQFIHQVGLQFGDLPISASDEPLWLSCNLLNSGLKKLAYAGYEPQGNFDPTKPSGRTRSFELLAQFLDRVADSDSIGAAILARKLRADLRRVREIVFDAFDCRHIQQSRDLQRQREQRTRAVRGLRPAA